MRGTGNEEAVLNFLKRQPYTKAVFCMRLLAVKNGLWLASSPEGIITLDISKLPKTFSLTGHPLHRRGEDERFFLHRPELDIHLDHRFDVYDVQ